MIRIVEGILVITTTKVKPKKGDWMVLLQVGTKFISGNEIPRKRFLKYHDGSKICKFNTIVHGTEKVLFKFGGTK